MSQDISSTAPQAGVVTFEVPLFFSVDLDTDASFRGFSPDDRVAAITMVAAGIAKLANATDMLDVTAGLATQVERVPV